MVFNPKSFNQILASMAAKLSAETPITDYTPGGVALTLLETSAQEDFQQYVQMVEVIKGYNLDTTEGEDLDARAAEVGLTRLIPRAHSGFVTISDTRFTKVSSKLYAGLAGPTAGTFKLYVEDASTFPATGSVYIGRGTANSEGPIAYSAAPVDNTSYWEITLDVALTKDHGTDESVILSQFGNRVVIAGTEVRIPENDFTEELNFELNQSVELLDGEDSVENVLVTATQEGGFEVPANSIIQFANSPFTGSAVSNPLPFVNGRDEETDQELRDRIRSTIQSLSRGVSTAIETNILGLIDESTNSSVVSANIIPPVILADGPTKVYIDNGRGLEPSIDGIGLETLLESATGGEQFLQLENFPLVKANVISQNFEPFSLTGSETLIYQIGTSSESFQFLETDFVNPESAKATEVAEAINNRATLIEARTITDSEGKKVILWAKTSQNEDITISSDSTAQSALNFTTDQIFTSKIYKNDTLLTKDGLTAFITSNAQPFNMSVTEVTTTDSDITVTGGSKVITKTAAGSYPFRQFVKKGDYIKYTSDNESFYSKVKYVASDLKLILEEEYPVLGGGTGDLNIWNSPQLEVAANGDIFETEIISFAPSDFSNPSQALASEVLARLEVDLNLSNAQLSTNNTRLTILSTIENSSKSKMQITGGGAATSLGFNTSAPLTGTITVVGGSNEVTGVGTLFTSELTEGQWIKIDSHNSSSWSKISAIESDTTLYLEEGGYRGQDASAAGLLMNFSELSEGKDRDYTLNNSNGQIEFTSPLIAGDNITAGSIDTRAFVDSSLETFNFDSIGATSSLIVCVDGGIQGQVTTGDAAAPFNSFIDSSLVDFGANYFDGFYLEWTSGNNIGETSFIGSYDNATGQIDTITDFTNPILVDDQFKICQVIEFTHASDFTDPLNALAFEVVSAINSQIFGGLAEENADGSVRVRTNNFSDGSIEIIGGSANNVLNFSTDVALNQETNVAYLKSQNSDRDGISSTKGFTLGPDQNLIVILDNDFTNKTFSVPLKVSGTVTTGGAGSFSDSTIGAEYTTNSFFKDFWIYWLTGTNAGSLHTVGSYTGVTGAFTFTEVYPVGAITNAQVGDTFSLVPRTAENFVALCQDLNTTTLSILANIENTGLTGDNVQISTKTNGSDGKTYVTGGTANSFGILIESILPGSPINDVSTNSKSGLSLGLPVYLTVDASVSTGDASIPYNTFIAESLISALPAFYDSMEIEFLTGNNAGTKTSISSYNNTTGEIILTDAMNNEIQESDNFRIKLQVFISSISGTEAPYEIGFEDINGANIDVSGFITDLNAAIRDVNGLNFSNIQVEGVDGYKHFIGLIQKTQWTIDGLDRDLDTYPGVGAAGTQFEVLPPVLVTPTLTIDVTTESGVNLSSIVGNIRSAILEYTTSRDVGEDLVLSEIIAAAQSVAGVYDVEITSHTANIVIADNELVIMSEENVIIG